ncbi:MAG: type II toxin-antitoxin system RelE/ParE family toxin [Actinomycetota bacterium]|nr:type II toxin-antitoxin system RelE/ParE family toxin [Actinomycetota bacterium]
MSEPYELATTPPARRALSHGLPPDVALATAEFVTGALPDKPRRMGKPLRDALTGIYSARRGREWRVLYEIDESRHLVIVLDVRRRASAYRPR